MPALISVVNAISKPSFMVTTLPRFDRASAKLIEFFPLATESARLYQLTRPIALVVSATGDRRGPARRRRSDGHRHRHGFSRTGPPADRPGCHDENAQRPRLRPSRSARYAPAHRPP